MATWSVFTSQVPDFPSNSDATPAVVVANAIRFTAAGTITHVRFYKGPLTAGSYQAIVWKMTDSATGTKQAIGPAGALFQDFSGTPTDNAWNTIALTNPITVTSGSVYTVAVRNSAGEYVFTGGFFNAGAVNTAGLTNGPLNAVGSAQALSEIGGANIINNTYYIGSNSAAVVAIPTSYFNGSNYFVDVVFNDSSTTPFTKDYTISWDVRNTFTKDYTVAWQVRNAITKDYTLAWQVRNLLTKDYTLAWQVRALFTKDYTVSWDIRNLFTKDYTLVWQVRNSFTKDYQVLWDVQSGTGFNKDYQIVWDVRNSFTKDYTLAWQVRNSFNKDYTLAWAVRNNFVKDYQIAWDILTSTGFVKDYQVLWNIRNTFTKDYQILWRILAAGAITMYLWDGTNETLLTLEGVWDGNTVIPYDTLEVT